MRKITDTKTYNFVHPQIARNAAKHIRRYSVEAMLSLEKGDHIPDGFSCRFSDIWADTRRAVVLLFNRLSGCRLNLGSRWEAGEEMRCLDARFVFQDGELDFHIDGSFDRCPADLWMSMSIRSYYGNVARSILTSISLSSMPITNREERTRSLDRKIERRTRRKMLRIDITLISIPR